MTKRDHIIQQLLAAGYERVPSIGSTSTVLAKGNISDGTSLFSVSVGPRGRVGCWVTTVIKRRAVSRWVTLDEAVTAC